LWAAGEPDEALAFYGRRFDALALEIDLLERRIREGVARPDEAMTAIRHTRSHVTDAAAVGDLAGLEQRLDGLEAVVAEQRARRREDRAKAQETARDEKEKLVVEAEAIAESKDWRAGSDRLQALLTSWKALPRLDKPTDDALWQRFAAARATYTRQRRSHFAALAEHRGEAKARKTAIAAEAETLASSTDWGATSARFRDLMTDWKAAGSASRSDEDALWRRFRAAQDTFFSSRTNVFNERDRSEVENQRQKEELLVRAEALVPVHDLASARASLREIQDSWSKIGRVPRPAVARLESQLRKVEEAVRLAEQAEWQRTSPEALARAETTVSRLRTSVAQLEATLEKADAQNDAVAAAAAREALTARREWLAEAERTLADFRR
jgi:hypothetical protein